MSKENNGIESVEQKYGFEQKQEPFQRLFIVLLVLFLSGGLMGLFGEGYFSTSREEGENFYIEYQQFLRDESNSSFSIFINKSSGDTTVVTIGKNYISKVELKHVVPQPEKVEAKSNKLVYTFNVADNGLIVFHFIPEQVGVIDLDISVQNNQKHITQFVFF